VTAARFHKLQHRGNKICDTALLARFLFRHLVRVKLCIFSKQIASKLIHLESLLKEILSTKKHYNWYFFVEVDMNGKKCIKWLIQTDSHNSPTPTKLKYSQQYVFHS
jgi:hypothetical protein